MFILILHRVWNWLKKHWKYIVIPIALIVLIFAAKNCYDNNSGALLNILDKRQEVHEKEIKELNKIHAEELDARDEAIKEFQQKLEDINKNYQSDIKKLNQKKEKEIKEKSELSPQELAENLADEFGFDIYRPL